MAVMSGLYRAFEFENRKTNLRTEIIAGTTTFLAMAYIIFVHPSILATTGMDRTALIAVTCLVTAISTIAAGVFGRAPIAMAPGMGLNAFFTYSLVIGRGISWQTALGAVFVSGLAFLILALLGVRRQIAEAIPRSLLASIAAGIGLFITFIGLVNLGLVVNSDATLVTAGAITPSVGIGLVALLLIAVLEFHKVPGAMVVGILVATLIAVAVGMVAPPSAIISTGIDIRPIAFQLDIVAALQIGLLSAIFALMFVDLFDSIGTLLACLTEAKLITEDGSSPVMGRLLVIDALATMFGALMGTSTTTAFIESAAGISQGGRTGFTSIVTGFWFLLALLFIPVVALVPPYATAPALIMVGLYMMREVRHIDFGKVDEGIPAFLILVLMPLNYSISSGLAAGFVSYVLLKAFTGNIREIKFVMWIVAGLSLLHYVFPV